MSVRRSATDWALLLTLAAMWGSAFMFNKISVASVPPATVVAARLAISALILVAVVRTLGLGLPPPGRIWAAYFMLAMVGNAVPFFLITWGQKVVDSASAGILMAMMPLTTLVLAHFFVAGEHMTRTRLAGFTLGFAGIVVLIGPAALTGIGGSALQVVSQLAVLTGALCYATNSVLTRLMVKGNNVLVASTAMLLVATVVMLPVALILDRPWTLAPSFSSTAAIVWLGIGPTAVATLCYFKLIGSAGPTFMSLVNYLSPPVAVFLGVTLMGEHPGVEAYTGLALILAGIALSQFRRRTPSAS